MRILLDANMPRSALAVPRRHGHDAEHVRDTGLGAAGDAEVAARARADGAVLVTRDLDFADVRNYPAAGTPGMLVLRVPDDRTTRRIVDLLDKLLAMDALVARLPGHLAILDPHHVRFRPALD